MVHNPSLPGVRVFIRTHGTPLKEYVDSDTPDNDKTVTRYIQATDEAVFDIHFEIDRGVIPKGQSLSLECYVDGHFVDGPLVSDKDRTCTSVGKQISPTMLKQYCFGKLDLSKCV